MEQFYYCEWRQEETEIHLPNFHFKSMQTFSNSSQMYNFMIVRSIQYFLSVFFFFRKIHNAYITHNAVQCEKKLKYKHI